MGERREELWLVSGESPWLEFSLGLGPGWEHREAFYGRLHSGSVDKGHLRISLRQIQTASVGGGLKGNLELWKWGGAGVFSPSEIRMDSFFWKPVSFCLTP